VTPPDAHARRTLAGAAVLAGVLAGAATVGFAVAADRPGRPAAVAFAGLVCLGGSLAGWLVARWRARAPATAVARGLAAVGLRIAPPLVALGWLQTAPELRRAGADGLLVAFYLALLAADLGLHMLLGQPRDRGSSS